MEAIYSGKEVEKYKLLPAKNYILFDRSHLQQVAPEEIYRTPVKLLYQTISKYLKVAIDTSGSLSTNSANIIIPKLENIDIYSLLGLLNSDLYSYLHLKLFGGVNKIAKENLMALPLPRLTQRQNETLKNLVLKTMDTGDDSQAQNYINEEIFDLSVEQVQFISRAMS